MRSDLEKLLDNAYAPYSCYKVASIVVTKDDKHFAGVNVENASYGATICAERNAINLAVSHGYRKGDFASIHVMNDSDTIGVPCFLCRQTMSEFFDMDNDVILYTKSGLEQSMKVKDLVVKPFTSESLPK